MNYFELFEIPLSFEVDNTLLTRKYYELSRLNHPDKFTLKSEEEQLKSIEMTSKVNKAYKTLSDLNMRRRYVLEILGVKFEEGKEKIDQSFLMEMMEVNELVMELQLNPTPGLRDVLADKINAIKSSNEEEFHAAAAGLDFEAPDNNVLDSIKNIYLKSKYVKRLQQHLDH